MSKIALSSNTSGTGVFTIASPGTNTNQTLTLPDATGTVNISGLANEVPSGNTALPAIYPTGDNNTGIFFPAADTIAFAEGGVESMRIDSAGNMLVGKTTSSAGCRFELERTDNDNGLAEFKTNNASGDVLIRSSGGYVRLRATGTNEMAFFSANSERMRIDSSGNLLVGTAENPNTAKIAIGPTATNGIAIESSNTSVVMSQIVFRNPNGIVGAIQTSGSTTTYATSSDYRLKENVQPMQNALDTVAQLNPVTYTWKIDGSDGQGFIAHELQAVVPDCVAGEKDAVDAEGNPQYQGVDTSFLVATLVKAIQEQQAIITQQATDITSLTDRITALESTK